MPGIDVKYKITALSVACQRGKLEMARTLISHGADIFKKDAVGTMYPLALTQTATYLSIFATTTAVWLYPIDMGSVQWQ